MKEAAKRHAPWAVTLVTVLGALYPFWSSLVDTRAEQKAAQEDARTAHAEVVRPINECAELLEEHDRTLWEVNRRLVWLEQAQKASRARLTGVHEPGHLLMPPPRRKLSRLSGELDELLEAR